MSGCVPFLVGFGTLTAVKDSEIDDRSERADRKKGRGDAWLMYRDCPRSLSAHWDRVALPVVSLGGG